MQLSSSGLSSPGPDRRTLLRGMGGAVALGAGIPLLSACGGSGTASDPKTVTVGSNASDAVPKKAFADIYAAYKKKSGITVDVITKDHNTFQEQINSYLQGTPDDVFHWFAGYRMQFFAGKGLATPIDDVWKTIGDNFSVAMKVLSQSEDGNHYFVPLYTYPWALFYRKSVFKQYGYEVPTTWDQLVALCKRMMQKDGLVPIAFGDKDAWPAMGTFDQINFRANGYDFHVELMAGKASWLDAKVRKTFDLWTELLPYHQDGAVGRTWQDAAQTLASKKAGMYLLGTFVAQQITDKAALEDLDFFAFPEIDPAYGQDTVEAPTDGFMLSKAPKNKAGGSPAAEQIYLKSDPSVVAASRTADTSSYTPLRKKAYEMISGAKHLTQFMDRDSRPDFTSTVMQPALQKFIRDPKGIDRRWSPSTSAASASGSTCSCCAFVLSNFMRSLPHELTEAALVDGASVWRLYWQITLPLCKPAMAALATLPSIWIYNDFSWAIVLISTGENMPITSALNNLSGQYFTDPNLIAAGALLTAIPTLIVYFALQRQFVSGLTLGANKG